MKQAMVGHWIGELIGTDGNGDKFEAADAFTFVLTSEDGLDSATWSSDTLEHARHQGHGRYRIQSWNRTGHQSEIQLSASILDGPDASGNGVWLLELEQRAADGTIMETRERFELRENSLHMIMEMRPANSAEPFETRVTGMWSRWAPSR